MASKLISINIPLPTSPLQQSLKMEESDTSTHKVSDSGYSNSCNSQSQRSSGSSKSRHSNSSGSSGYGGHPSTLGSGNDVFPHPVITKRNKDHKKKKLKTTTVSATNDHHAEPKKEVKNLISSPVNGHEGKAGNEGNKSSGKTTVGNGIGISCVSIAPLNGTIVPKHENVPTLEPAHGSLGQPPGKELVEALLEESDISSSLAIENLEQDLTVNCLRSIEGLPSLIESEFSTIVSLHDGIVMYTTSSISNVLGFPKDMWLGRSFIDFVHPKDRMAFASQISTGIAVPVEDCRSKVIFTPKENFYCCLRKYKGLKANGYGITEKKVTYLPFHLTMTFREVLSTEKLGLEEENPGVQGKFLIIVATLVKSSYTYPDETNISSNFLTRHHASCLLSHVDPEMVPYLGYLPQDMVGRSVFEFYHPEDSPFLKEVYEGVIKEDGKPFRSRPYRFRTQNGGYVLLDTEWSAFINPWSRKLEFVVGQHRVLKGPKNPDVFAAATDDHTLYISEAVLRESRLIQQEIEQLLRETVPRRNEVARQQATKRCKDVASFMESLMDEVIKPQLKIELPSEERSFSNNIFSQERDSVMLGEISPHHDYYDSKSSSETPPSYNQLNYKENIQRFFESKPKTTLSDESGELKTEANRFLNSTDEERKSMPVADSSLDSSNRKFCSPVNGSGSGSRGSSGSAGMPASAPSRGDTSATNTSRGSYKPPHLTEALLYRHNEDMEKQMVQRHRESRSKSDRDGKKKSHDKLQEHCHGIKRSGSHSWGEHYKASKHPHMDNLLNSRNTAGNPGHGTGPSSVPPLYQSSSNVNLWPPFSVTVTPLQGAPTNTPQRSFANATMGNSPSPLTGVIPIYYIPTGAQQTGLSPQALIAQEHPGQPSLAHPSMLMPGQPSYVPSQVPFVNPITGMVYQPVQPVYGAQPMMYSSVMLHPSHVLPAPMVQTGLMSAASRSMMKHDKPQEESGTPNGMGPSTKFQRPASQATSVKAEPGSAMGSIASASVKRAMSECSKKEKSVCSPEPHHSSHENSPDEDKPNNKRTANGFGLTRETENTTGDDSSYSSFYSFLRTDKSDESMKSSPQDKEFSYSCKPEDMIWEKSESKDSTAQEKQRPILKDPPWLEQVDVTPDLMFRYQMTEENIESVLEKDLQALRKIQQPLLVNDQLSQLYMEMELEGLSTKLKLEERIAPSSSGSSGSSGEEAQGGTQKKRKRRSLEYSKLVMLFEENAPLPPPVHH